MVAFQVKTRRPSSWAGCETLVKEAGSGRMWSSSADVFSLLGFCVLPRTGFPSRLRESHQAALVVRVLDAVVHPDSRGHAYFLFPGPSCLCCSRVNSLLSL